MLWSDYRWSGAYLCTPRSVSPEKQRFYSVHLPEDSDPSDIWPCNLQPLSLFSYLSQTIFYQIININIQYFGDSYKLRH